MTNQRTADEDAYLAFSDRIRTIRSAIWALLGVFGAMLLALGVAYALGHRLPRQGWIAIVLAFLAGQSVGGLFITRSNLRSYALKRLPLRRARVIDVDWSEAAATLAVDREEGGYVYMPLSTSAPAEMGTVEVGQELAVRVPPHQGEPFIDWPETFRRYPLPRPLVGALEAVEMRPEGGALLSLSAEGPEGVGLTVAGAPVQVDAANRRWLQPWTQVAIRVTSSGVVFDWAETARHHAQGAPTPPPSPDQQRAQLAQQRAYRVAALTHAIDQLDLKCLACQSGKLSTTATASVALLVGVCGTILSTLVLRPWLYANQSVCLVGGSSMIIATALGAPLAWAAEALNARERRAQIPALQQKIASLERKRANLERSNTQRGPFR